MGRRCQRIIAIILLMLIIPIENIVFAKTDNLFKEDFDAAIIEPEIVNDLEIDEVEIKKENEEVGNFFKCTKNEEGIFLVNLNGEDSYNIGDTLTISGRVSSDIELEVFNSLDEEYEVKKEVSEEGITNFKVEKDLSTLIEDEYIVYFKVSKLEEEEIYKLVISNKKIKNTEAYLNKLVIEGGELLDINNYEATLINEESHYYIIKSNEEELNVFINPIVSKGATCEINGEEYIYSEYVNIKIDEYINKIKVKSEDGLMENEYYFLFQDNQGDIPLFTLKDVDKENILQSLNNKLEYDMTDSFWGIFKNFALNIDYDLNGKLVYDLSKYKYDNAIDYCYFILQLVLIGQNPYGFNDVNYVNKLLELKTSSNEEVVMKYIALKAVGENISDELIAAVKAIALDNNENINNRALALSVISNKLSNEELMKIAMEIKAFEITEDNYEVYGNLLIGLNGANINFDYYNNLLQDIIEKCKANYSDNLIIALGDILNKSTLWERVALSEQKIISLINKGQEIINDESIILDKSNLIELVEVLKGKLSIEEEKNNLGINYYCLYDEIIKFDNSIKPKYIIDDKAPVGIITVGEDKFSLNEEPNNKFVENEQKVTIEAIDSESEVKSIEYKILSELNGESYNEEGWIEYNEPFVINDKPTIVLVKITDLVGNITYVNSDKYIFENTDIDDEEYIGRVKVIIENNTASDSNIAWFGKILQFNTNIYEGNTLEDVITRALKENNISYLNNEEGYITSINDLALGNGGEESKWMVLINDWFINTEYKNLSVYNGDTIKITYTKDNGLDIGADYNCKDTSLSSLSFSVGTLSKEFISSDLGYILTLPEGTKDLSVFAKAKNPINKIVIKNITSGFESTIPHRDGELIPVNHGDEIYINVGNDDNDYTTYVIKIVVEGTLDLMEYGTSLESPQLNNTSIGFYFKAMGKGDVKYRFIAFKDGVAEYVRAYSSKDSGTWTPTKGGNYTLYFKIKDSSEKEICKTIEFKIEQPLTMTNYELDDNGDYKIGDTIKLSADAVGMGSVKYRFIVLRNGLATYVRAYNKNNTANWVPKEGGIYTVYFKAKDDSGEEITSIMNYTINQPLEIKNYGINKDNFSCFGDPIELYTEAVGQGLKYRFVVLKDGKSSFVRGYKTTNKTEWKPEAPGKYVIYFKVMDSSGTELTESYEIDINLEEKDRATYLDFVVASQLTFIGEWERISNSLAYLGNTYISKITGDSIEYTFEGTGINIHYLEGPNNGNILFNLDDEYITVDTYNEKEGENFYSFKGLENGKHTITITNLGKGEKNTIVINYLSIEKFGKYSKEEIDIDKIKELEQEYKKDVNIDIASNTTEFLYPTNVYQLNRYASTIINPQTLKLSYKNRGILVYDFNKILDKNINKAVLKLVNDKAKVYCDGNNNVLQVGLLLKEVDETVTWSKVNDSTDCKWFASEKVYWLEKWYTGNTIDITGLIKYVVENKIETRGIVLKWEYNDVINPIIIDNYDIKASLIVDCSESLNIEQKIENGSKHLIENYKNNKYGWISSSVYTSLMTLYKDYGNKDALETLKIYFDRYVNENGEIVLSDGTISNLTIYEADLSRILLELYKITNEEKYLKVVEKTLSAYSDMKNGLYLVDGGLITELSYFGLPFLVEYGEYVNDNSYVDTAVNQLLNLYGYMMQEQDDRVMITLSRYINSKGWSRGVGWLYAGLSKMLTYDSIKNHKYYEILVNIYQEISNVILEYQQDSGLWSSIIQDDEYFEETSGTALFISGIDIGLDEGLLSEKFVHAKYKAINGLTSKMIIGAEIGNVFQFNIRSNHLSNKEENVSDIGWGLAMEALLNVYKPELIK